MRVQLQSEQFASHIDAPSRPLPTPLAELNRVLHGGLPPATLTEVYGGHTAFKTQFVLTLAVRVALAGQNALIIDVDGTAHSIRLREIARSLAVSPADSDAAFARLFVVPVTDWPQFTALALLLPHLVERLVPAFIAVDSLPTLLRTCAQPAALKRMEATFAKLRALAAERDICFVVVNGARQDEASAADSNSIAQPAMGESWKSVMGTRLYLHRQRDGTGLVRIIKSGLCIHSPHQQPIPFRVTERGVVECTQL